MRVLLIVIAAMLIFGCTGGKSVSRESSISANATKMTPETDLYPPELHSSEWLPPVPLPAPVNTPGAEDSPFITPDGKSLYFFFTPDPNIPPTEQLGDGVTGIYVSRKSGDSWSEPERIVLSDSTSLEGCGFVQGNTMWFCSARKGNFRPIDIFTAEYVNGKWTGWENAGRLLNAEYQVGELHINGDELYFHSNREGGLGEVDIWVTNNSTGSWSAPENVYALNSAGTEGWPFVTSDGNELWFLRMYKGTPGIFRSTKQGGQWSEPELILSSFAGEPSLDNQGNIYFVHHFYRDGDMVEADIYVAQKIRAT